MRECQTLMWQEWNPRCEPPWDPETLGILVAHAYQYGTEPIGSTAPEVEFANVDELPWDLPNGHATLHPYDEMNKEHAFVLAGGGAHILWETTDAFGRYKLEHLAMTAFKDKFAPVTIG